MIERMDLFRAVADRRTDEVVIATMTATLQWPLVSQHPLDFDFLAFGMGHASDFGLGLALAQPERSVIVFKGDGGLLMSLGSLVTLGRYGPDNLIVILLENRVYEMTGGQSLPDRVDFTGLARAAGVEGGGRGGTGTIATTAELGEFASELDRALTSPGPHLIIGSVTNSEPLPPVAHTDHAGRITKLREGLGVG
jgi:thiamine pyrophosphate-dependent acetolactate synthase large subunit-like protein